MSSTFGRNDARRRPERINRRAFLVSLAIMALAVLAKAWPL
jgi:hypothetical protein